MSTSLSPEVFDWDDIRPVSDPPRQSCGSVDQSGRMPALDALRGLAAVMVVFHHFYLTLPSPWLEIAHGWLDWPGLRPIIIGRPAVILFFVLSGFVLTRSMQREAELSLVKFVMRRCLRIYPPFLARHRAFGPVVCIDRARATFHAFGVVQCAMDWRA